MSSNSGEPSFCQRCCCCCLQICLSQEKNRKFSGIEYEAISSKESILAELPIPEPRKSFVLQQEKASFAIPIQLSDQDGSHASTRAVQLQPSHTDSRGMFRSNHGKRSSLPPKLPSYHHVFPVSHENLEECSITSPSSLASGDDAFPEVWRPSLPSIEDEEEEGEEGDRKSVSSASSVALNPPEMEFSLYYDIMSRTLTVHLHSAKNLSQTRKKGPPNTIVLLYLIPNREDIMESKLVENSTNPRYDQSLEFRGLLPDEIRRQTLVLRVYGQSLKGVLLGGIALPLSDADLLGMKYRMKLDTDIEKLKLITRGDMLISVLHNPATSTLHGVLLKATNLQKQDVLGLADPYVKIWMLHKGKRNQKWKSSIKRNTLAPIFNESFQFDVSGMDISNIAMEILLVDYDRFSRNDIVGVVYLGHRVPHSTGRAHWEQVTAQPSTSISNWHAILPINSSTERTTKKRKTSEPVLRSLDSLSSLDSTP